MLFKSHYKNLCSYAYLFVKDADSAEDMVQEVFYKLWKNKEKLKIDSSIKSYLFRSVRNACMNFLEHMKVRDGYREFSEANNQRGNSTYDHAIVNELERKIKETIDKLPPERRNEGLKYREIAEELDISVKTVENQMYQALSFLRENLKEYLPFILMLFFLRN